MLRNRGENDLKVKELSKIHKPNFLEVFNFLALLFFYKNLHVFIDFLKIFNFCIFLIFMFAFLK